ncbi:MAG: right-handed parallel beta-helix repeat-containing protein, partial [Deltaproteobacteria bacterium]|nr:right-handed parallel beta-helix repeat-containing protein [Nannocystaceae bacterium]
ASYGIYDNGEGDVIDLALAMDVDLDYDGFGTTAGMFTGNLGGITFASLAELQANTSEAHAIEVGLSVFASEVVVPDSAFPSLAPADLRLADGGAPVDAGEPIAGLPHDGAAPDLGAYELGDELPVYGPRR